MSETIIAALIGFAGVIFGVIITPVANYMLSKRSRIVVSTRVYPYVIPDEIKEELRSLTKKSGEITYNDSDIIYSYRFFLAYANVKIQNIGTIKVDNICLNLRSNGNFFSEMNSSKKWIMNKYDNTLDLGSLKPNETKNIRVWLTDYIFDEVCVLADNCDKIIRNSIIVDELNVNNNLRRVVDSAIAGITSAFIFTFVYFMLMKKFL